METNAIFHVENDITSLWCKFCKIYFDSDDLFDHIEEDEDHVSRIEEINELIEDEDISIESYCENLTQDKAYCGRCKVWVPCSSECLKQHIDGEKHRHWSAEYYKKLNAIFHVENDDDQLWCKFCKIYFDSDDLFDHIEDDEDHVSLIEEINGLTKDEDISIGNYCAIYAQDKAYCGRCKVWVPCSSECLEQHIDGHQHKHLSAEYFMKLNAIFHVKDDEDQLWCKICNMYFEYITYDDLYDHINGDTRHCELINEIDELIDGEGIEYDSFSENVKAQYKVYCTRCSVWIPCNYECIRQHVNGSRHNNA